MATVGVAPAAASVSDNATTYYDSGFNVDQGIEIQLNGDSAYDARIVIKNDNNNEIYNGTVQDGQNYKFTPEGDGNNLAFFVTSTADPNLITGDVSGLSHTALEPQTPGSTSSGGSVPDSATEYFKSSFDGSQGIEFQLAGSTGDHARVKIGESGGAEVFNRTVQDGQTYRWAPSGTPADGYYTYVYSTAEPTVSGKDVSTLSHAWLNDTDATSGTTSGATDPISYEFTGSPDSLVIHTSDMDLGTQFKVEYATDQGPTTGTTVLARETFNTANIDNDQLWFRNGGAYESVTVTVSDYSGGEPKFETGGRYTPIDVTAFGSTGGDSDLNCGTIEKIGQAAGGYQQLDCTPNPGSTAVNTTGLDANETKVEIHQAGLTAKAGEENTEAIMSNYLNDTKTQALLIGKNAYIRSLNNGSVEPVARTDAQRAIDDYYAKKEVNLINTWNTQVATYEGLHATANATTGISAQMAGQDPSTHFVQMEGGDNIGNGDRATLEYAGVQTVNEPLSNGSSAQALAVIAQDGDYEDDLASNYYAADTYTLTPSNKDVYPIRVYTTNGNEQFTNANLTVGPPNENFDREVAMEPRLYADIWADIQTQHTDAKAQMDTLVNNTYSEYQAGDINNSDLVDPYIASHQYSPSNSQTWAAAQLSTLGVGTPENFDQIGTFNITTESGDDYTGVLLAQNNPESGQFEAGNTYNPAAIQGQEYVITPDSTEELTANFTITDIRNTDGEPIQNVTIRDVTYQSSDVSGLRSDIQNLTQLYAEIDARQDNQNNGGGGALLSGGNNGLIIIGGGVLLLVLLARREENHY